MNWERVRLGEVCNMKSGGTPSRKKSSFFGGNIKWCKISDIENATEGIVYDTEEKITEEGLSDINGRIFSEGTLLLAMYGSVGKVAFINEQMSVNQAILGINIKNLDILDSKFLYYWFIGERRNLVNKAVGVTLKNISKGIVESLTIPLPPMSVQKEIVEKLDKAAAIREKSKALLSHYDALAESLFIELFGDPISNEKGWEKKKLGEVCEKIGDGLHGTPIYDDTGEYYFINGNNINNRKIKITEKTKRVGYSEYIKNKKDLNANTVFVSINGTLGNVGFYNDEKIILGKSICYLNIKTDIINKDYIYCFLDSDYFKKYANRVATGSTIKNVSLKSMRDLEIPLPPLSLQVKFAEMVENIEEQKARAKAEIEQSEAVFQALLQESFG